MLSRLIGRNRQGARIRDKIVSGIVPVEKVEELDEGHQRPAFADLERTADAQIHLDVGRAAELVERRLHAVDDGAIVGGSPTPLTSTGVVSVIGPRALRLRKSR